MQSKNSQLIAQSWNSYFAQSHSRIVAAQSRNRDQVKIFSILFPLRYESKKLNLILTLMVCLFDVILLSCLLNDLDVHL